MAQLFSWSPPETAPKDGSRILVLEQGKHHSIVFWAKFYSTFHRGEVEGWWTSADPGRACVIYPQDMTNWAPLPTPPPSKVGEQADADEMLLDLHRSMRR